MKEKRILVLSFYYPPDLSAGSFRTGALVEALQQSNSYQLAISVITTQPNRYSSFSLGNSGVETGPVSVRRISLPPHRSGMLDQAMAFRRFRNETLKMIRDETYDLIFATSSRLMTAALGANIARRLKVPLYLDIRDIFADTIRDVLPLKSGILIEPFVSILERKTIRTARHVNLVSQGFETYFKKRYPNQSYSFFTNGVDEEFIGAQAGPAGEKAKKPDQPVRILYAGNIGEGQGLHHIIPALARRLNGHAVFKLLGDGGRKTQIQAMVENEKLTNVQFAPPVSRKALLGEYQDADVLFLHLNNHPAFKKVLPSKIFEYAALGKPIWAGVPGYAASFLKSEVANVGLFPPCNCDEAMTSFRQLQLGYTNRAEFARKYSRKSIMNALAQSILSILP